jgi:ferrous iron transport protein A
MALVDLTQLKAGEEGTVIEISGGIGIHQRLEAMGVRPGVKIKKISTLFRRGPVTIEIGNTKIAIGFGMARKVIVERISHEDTKTQS